MGKIIEDTNVSESFDAAKAAADTIRMQQIPVEERISHLEHNIGDLLMRLEKQNDRIENIFNWMSRNLGARIK